MQALYIQNASTVLPDERIAAVIPALQIHLSEHFAPEYGFDRTLIFTGKKPAPENAWHLIIANNSDQAGALGYHDLSKFARPVGFIFAADDIKAGASWECTLCHELDEMGADARCNLTVIIPGRNGSATALAKEVNDPTEADELGYKIKAGGVEFLASDFVTEAWFGAPKRNSDRFDFMGHCSKPFQILKGGYLGVMKIRAAGGWGTVTARLLGRADASSSKWEICRKNQNGTYGGPALAPHEIPKYSRRWRRTQGVAA